MKVGIAGLGVIGKRVAQALIEGIEGLRLEGVCSRDQEKAHMKLRSLNVEVPLLSPHELAAMADIIVECVPKAAFREIAEPAMRAGRTLITVSGAGLLEYPEIIDLARENQGRIILATGAILGLDAVRAAAEGVIHEVRMVTRKPPKSLQGAPYIEEHRISIENLSEPLQIFKGTAREGAKGFPANVNVAAALGLAGIGPDKTKLEIWADPDLERNTHTIHLDSDSTRFSMTIESIPSEENSRTGKLTALSVIAALRGLKNPFHVGS